MARGPCLSTLARGHPACYGGAGTPLGMELHAARPLRALCSYRRRRPADVVQGGGGASAQTTWSVAGEQRMFTLRVKQHAPVLHPGSSRLSLPPLNSSTRALETAVIEQLTSPGSQAPATTRFLSLAPPSPSCRHAAGVRTFLHRRFAMTTLRCTLLVVLLLNVVLFIVPGQASASRASRRCFADFRLCGKRGLRCRECRDACMILSKNSPPGLGVHSLEWSLYCDEMIGTATVTV